MNPPLIIDLLIVLVLAGYLYNGYLRGFILLAFELIGAFLTFYLAWRGGDWFGGQLARLINFPESYQQIIGFLILWFILQAAYALISSLLYGLIPDVARKSLPNKILGTIPSMVKGLLTVAILLTLTVIAPIQNDLGKSVMASRLGPPLVETTQKAQQYLTRAYSDDITKTLTFLTTTPIVRRPETEPGGTVKLHFTTDRGIPDPAAEAQMLKLVNEERAKRGLSQLTVHPKLQLVARAHARDMLERGYFSHNSPEGLDPFDRIEAAKIRYQTAGENLAFAPTVELAHVGLMNSPKHLENIVYPEFGQLGMGVIDAGVYGLMFVQLFSN